MCIGWEINGEIWPAREGEIMILREMYLEIRRERVRYMGSSVYTCERARG